MDFRGFSRCEGTRLLTSSTVVTPQLEDYELFRNYRELPQQVSLKEKQPFMLVFNLSSVLESELEITRMMKNANQDRDVLEIEVMHSMKEDEGVVPFSRSVTYRFILPEELSDKPLTAFWTTDNHLILIESSNINFSLIESSNAIMMKEGMKVDTSVEGGEMLIKPIKMDCVFNPTVNVDVLRHTVAIAERDIFNVKKLIQDCSFVRPDIARPTRSCVEVSKPIEVEESYFAPVKEQLAVCMENLEYLSKMISESEKEKYSSKEL